MYFVEFTQIKGKKHFEECTGFYVKDDAMEFSLKLQTCANVKEIMVSEIDTSFADIIYKSYGEYQCLNQ